MEFSDIWFRNLSERTKQIGTSLACFIGGTLLLIAYFQSRPNALSYVAAEEAVAKWEASPKDELLYANMQKALQSVPELRKKHEGAIAQKLLDTNRVGEAIAIAKLPLNRIKNEVPFHSVYAETSLLIEEGSFQKALENAVALKEKMGASFLRETKGGALLYAYNLLRIACLQQELNNRPGEKAAWDELEAFLKTESPSAKTLLNNFSEKQVQLTDYISKRRENL